MEPQAIWRFLSKKFDTGKVSIFKDTSNNLLKNQKLEALASFLKKRLH